MTSNWSIGIPVNLLNTRVARITVLEDVKLALLAQVA